jgi:hypothetical protein
MSLSWVVAWRQSVVQWALSQFSASQWETLSLLFHLDDMVCLQESMNDCRHGRVMLMSHAFADLDSIIS